MMSVSMSAITRTSIMRMPMSLSALARKARLASLVRPDRISLPMINRLAVTGRSDISAPGDGWRLDNSRMLRTLRRAAGRRAGARRAGARPAAGLALGLALALALLQAVPALALDPAPGPASQAAPQA